MLTNVLAGIRTAVELAGGLELFWKRGNWRFAIVAGPMLFRGT